MSNFFKKRVHSFKYAFQGVATLFRETPNAIIHLIMAILAILLGIFFSISTTEWLAIIIVIGLVFAFEAINTSIETLSDFVCKQRNEAIKSERFGSCRVLVAAIAALAIGILIFLPKIIELFCK